MLPRALLLLTFGLAVAYAYQDDYNSYHHRYAHNDSIYQTSVFCYINGTRINAQSRMTSYQINHFTIDNIKVELCDYIIYGAAVLDPNTYTIRPLKDEYEMEQGRTGNKISFDEITELARRRGDLKVLISVSGEASDFSRMARSHREHFVKNVKDFLSKYKFDGINIDWRYPTRRGGQTDDRQNFALLMQEIKIALRPEAKKLGASLPPHRPNIVDGYDNLDQNLMAAVDFFFIMAFDYYGPFSNRVGANAPIRSREKMNVEKTISDVTDLFSGNLYKLVLAIPFYGRKYTLTGELRGDQSPINKEYVRLHGSFETNTLSYREICQKMNNEQGWRQGYDSETRTPYIVKDNYAIVYEDAQSVLEKTTLAIQNRLMGVMAYSLDMDDYVGDCGSDGRRGSSDGYGYNGMRDRWSGRKYPLLQSMHDTAERGLGAAGFSRASLGLVVLLAGLVAGLSNIAA